MKPTLDPLDGTLVQLLRSLGQEDRIAEARLAARWPSIAGPQLAERSYPLSLQKGLLTIGVWNSVWLHQLTFLRAEMLAKIQAAVGAELVRTIKFTLHAKPDWLKRTRRRTRPPQSPLAPEELASIEEACRSIADSELREAVRRVFTRQAALKGR